MSARPRPFFIILKLELMTYLLTVPLATIFLIIHLNYSGIQVVQFLEAVLGAVVVSFLFPAYRILRLKRMHNLLNGTERPFNDLPYDER